MAARVIVTLRFERSISALITQARAVVSAIGADPVTFPSPDPPLDEVTKHIDALSDAETIALTRAKGSAATRDVKLQVVKDDLRDLVAYVQKLCNARQDEAVAIAGKAALDTRVVTPPRKLAFDARLGDDSGRVVLVARAAKKGRKTFYEWQYSVDGGETWVSLPATVYADTTVAGLTPATMVSFRYRITDADGPHDWSDVVVLLVH